MSDCKDKNVETIDIKKKEKEKAEKIVTISSHLVMRKFLRKSIPL